MRVHAARWFAGWLLLTSPGVWLASCSAAGPAPTPPNNRTHAGGRSIRGRVDPAFREDVLKVAATGNSCLGGKKLLEGSWRYEGESRAKGFRDKMVFHGADFTEFLAADRAKGAEEGIIYGHYACIAGGRLVFFVDRVDPDGAFGNQSGDSFPCTLLWQHIDKGRANPNHLALLCHLDWNPARTTDYTYARVAN